MAEAVEARCLVCGEEAARLRYRIPRFRVLTCRSCEQIYLDPLPEPEEIRAMFAGLYTSGEGCLPELKSYFGFGYEDRPDNPLVQLYESWLDRIERYRRPGRLFDVGCGTGLFLAVARRRGWEPSGVDECAEAAEYAREHFGLEVELGDFSVLARRADRFDVVSGWDVIEHARDPLSLLRSMRRALAPGGLVALSTPNQRSLLELLGGALYRLTAGRLTAPLEKLYIAIHFLYFTPGTLERVLGRAELELLHLERELTDLRRLSLSPATRWMLQGLFLVARALRLENRLFALAGPSK